MPKTSPATQCVPQILKAIRLSAKKLGRNKLTNENIQHPATYFPVFIAS